MEHLIGIKKIGILAQQLDNIKASMLTQIRLFCDQPSSPLSYKLLVDRLTKLLEELSMKIADLGGCSSQLLSHRCQNEKTPPTRKEDKKSDQFWRNKKMLYESQLEKTLYMHQTKHYGVQLNSAQQHIAELQKELKEKTEQSHRQSQSVGQKFKEMNQRLQEYQLDSTREREQKQVISESYRILESRLDSMHRDREELEFSKDRTISMLKQQLDLKKKNQQASLYTDPQPDTPGFKEVYRQMEYFKEIAHQAAYQLESSKKAEADMAKSIYSYQHVQRQALQRQNQLHQAYRQMEQQKGQLEQEVTVLKLQLRETRTILHGLMSKRKQEYEVYR